MSEKKITIRIEPQGKALSIPAGTALKDILTGYGAEFPCGGKGTCGGCKVRILDGKIEADADHLQILKDLDLDPSFRLACKSILTHDVKLEIDQFQYIILSDNTPFEFNPREGFGIAFDLGTSTMVGQLVDLQNGQVIDIETRMNPQMIHGADLVTRMNFAQTKQGADTLKTLVRNAFCNMVERMVNRKGVYLNHVHIVGNTVMHHLFGGLDLAPLAVYPFETPYQTALEYDIAELGLRIESPARITFLPPMGSFVGSDILAGLLAIQVLQHTRPVALIDLGTNGEIAVAHRNRIVFASTAAGPAFEGTNISCGMRAATGAISSVRSSGGPLHMHVIGNVPAKGICGSGLIDLVAELLESGKIDLGGQLQIPADRIELTHQVYLTQKDIREFQLAKGAIASGLQILSNRSGLDLQQLDKIYIAGAFGNYIDLENTRKTGLLDFPDEKIQRMGNSALLGAKISLFGKQNEISDILERSEHVSLETQPDFMEIFAEKMVFDKHG